MKKITENERKSILEKYYEGKSRKEIGAEVGHSPATVQRAIKEHERKAKENGLVHELENERLTEPLELVHFYEQLKSTKLTLPDCRDALPVAQKCHDLKISSGRVSELIDAAVELAGPNFPREQFVDHLLRILKLEDETGQTITQMQATHARLATEVGTLRNQVTTLGNQVSDLESTKQRLDEETRTAQSTLTALQTRLRDVPVTETQLATYINDRKFLAANGLDISDLTNVRFVYAQLKSMNYNIGTIIETLSQKTGLETQIQVLTRRISELQEELDLITQRKEGLVKEVEDLATQRQELQAKIKQETEQTQTKIKELEKKIQDAIAANGTTEQALADFVATREALRKGDISL